MQGPKNVLLRLLVVLAAGLAVVAFACGDDGEGPEEPTATEGGTPAPTAAETPPDEQALCPVPDVGGVELDTTGLEDIPEDATGVTDTEIKLGTHMPLTGIAGVYGNAIVPGIQAYIACINEQGGINGRQINLIVKDDAYQPPQTNQVVRELVEQEGVFAIASGLGRPSTALSSSTWSRTAFPTSLRPRAPRSSPSPSPARPSATTRTTSKKGRPSASTSPRRTRTPNWASSARTTTSARMASRASAAASRAATSRSSRSRPTRRSRPT
jgi:hypothetical protein